MLLATAFFGIARPAAKPTVLNDTIYNMQMGAAQLADDIGSYNGSYVLAFAGYNAGRSARVTVRSATCARLTSASST